MGNEKKIQASANGDSSSVESDSDNDVYGLADERSKSQPKKVHFSFYHGSSRSKKHLTAASIYNSLSTIQFSDDDSANPLTWADVDHINSFMNSAIMNNGNKLAYYIGPINFGFHTDDAVQDALEHICERQTTDGLIINNHYNKELDKPFIFISNTSTLIAQNPTDVTKRGGTHWISWVLLPKKYLPLSGKEVNNRKYHVFFFDSLGSMSFPEELKKRLIEGSEFTRETDEGNKKMRLMSFCTQEEIDFIDLNNLTGQQMNGSDCGWWACYYVLMTVYTGSIEFLTKLQERLLSAKPLRSIIDLSECSNFFAVEEFPAEQKLPRLGKKLAGKDDCSTSHSIKGQTNPFLSDDQISQFLNVDYINSSFLRSAKVSLAPEETDDPFSFIVYFSTLFVQSLEDNFLEYCQRLWSRNYKAGKFVDYLSENSAFLGKIDASLSWMKLVSGIITSPLLCLSLARGKADHKSRIERLSARLHYYITNQKEARAIFINAIMGFVQAYEPLFMNELPKTPNELFNAIDDLVEDTVYRVINYFIKNVDAEISVRNIQLGILFGDSRRFKSSSTDCPNAFTGHRTHVVTTRFIESPGIIIGDSYFTLSSEDLIFNPCDESDSYSFRCLMDWEEKEYKMIGEDQVCLPYLNNTVYKKVQVKEKAKFKCLIAKEVCEKYAPKIYSALDKSHWQLTGDLQNLLKGLGEVVNCGFGGVSNKFDKLTEELRSRINQFERIKSNICNSSKQVRTFGQSSLYTAGKGFVSGTISKKIPIDDPYSAYEFGREWGLGSPVLDTKEVLLNGLHFFAYEFLRGFFKDIHEVRNFLAEESVPLDKVVEESENLEAVNREETRASKVANAEKLIKFVDSVSPRDLERFILEAAIKIFQAFERQFHDPKGRLLSNEVIRKLAFCAASRTIDYTSRENLESLSADVIVQGVVFGSSEACLKSLFSFKWGERYIDADEIYRGTAVFVSKEKVLSYSKSDVLKFGSRLPFHFEEESHEPSTFFGKLFMISEDDSCKQKDYEYLLKQINIESECQLILERIQDLKPAQHGDIKAIKKMLLKQEIELKDIKNMINRSRYCADENGRPRGPGDDGSGGGGGRPRGPGDDGSGGGGGRPRGPGGDTSITTLSQEVKNVGLGLCGNEMFQHFLSRKRRSDLPTEFNKKRKIDSSKTNREKLQLLSGVSRMNEARSLFGSRRCEVLSTVLNAVKNNDVKLVEDLSAHVDIDTLVDQYNRNPLHWAILHQKAEVLSVLLRQNPGLAELSDDRGLTPIDFAVEVDNPAILNFLLEGQAGAHAIGNSRIFESIFFCGVSFASLKVLNFLVNKRHDLINITDKDGMTPLHQAAVLSEASVGDCDPIDFLIRNGADCNATDRNGNTPLHYAASYRGLNVVDLLIQNSAIINVANGDGMTPLHYAIRDNEFDVVKYLIEQGADCNAADGNGNTSLHYAAENDKLDVVELLVTQGADCNVANQDGMAPLSFAAEDNALDVVEFLISRGARVEGVSEDSISPIHSAIENDSFEVSVFLSDIHLRSFHTAAPLGHTPLFLAILLNNDELARYLISMYPELINTPNELGFTPFLYPLSIVRRNF